MGATEGQRIVDEEQFGPALPILTYRDVDEVVARANATMYGLSGSVWSADVDRGPRKSRTGWSAAPPGLTPTSNSALTNPLAA